TLPDPDVRLALQRMLERVATIPGVEDVAAIFPSPLSGSGIATGARTEGSGDVWPDTFDLRLSSPGAFRILGIPLRAGRDFRADDVEGHPEILVVNEALARKVWPGQDPIGKRLALGVGSHALREVVGMVGDVRQEVDTPARPEAYVPIAQVTPNTFDLVLR